MVINKDSTNPPVIYVLATLFITFFIYSFSLFRGWQLFDERLFYDETLFPITNSLNEAFEAYFNFGINAHIESANAFFTNNISIRSTPVNWLFVIILLSLFKTNPVPYHIFQLLIHLINTSLVWLILYQTFFFLKTFSSKSQTYILTSILTLIWALHSINVESVLLTTNWNAIFAITFLFILLLQNLNSIKENNFNLSGLQFCIRSTIFLFAISLVEQAYIFPFIVFALIFSYSYKNKKEISYAFKSALKITSPYVLGLIVFSLIIISQDVLSALLTNKQNLNNFLERNIWLTPQIFVHNLKLLLFPTTLSTYQSNYVHLSRAFISPYYLLCTFIYIAFITAPIIGFVFFRKKESSFIYPIIYAFLFSLFPFLHILVPTYALSADRYLYFPSFLLIFLLVNVIHLIFTAKPKFIQAVLITLLLILCGLSTKTLFRIFEWKDSTSLISQETKITNPLYKGHRFKVLALTNLKTNNINEASANFEKSLKELNKALNIYKGRAVTNTNEPYTLKLYGLDYKSLLSKTAYLISEIKDDFYKESPSETLGFYEPFIEGNIEYVSSSELEFYSSLLLKEGKIEKARTILEYAYKKYPYSSKVLFSLAELYLNQIKDLNIAHNIIDRANKLFPHRTETLYANLKYYAATNDLTNLAKYAYLVGLRNHDIKSLEYAAQAYLNLKDLNNAQKSINILSSLIGNTPATLLLSSRYLLLKGNATKSFELLEKAYSSLSSESNNSRLKKHVLISLINVSIVLQNTEKAKYYLSKYAQMGDLSNEDKNKIQEFNTIIAKR